jgi:GNAT superfamily N-acetyltransferase
MTFAVRQASVADAADIVALVNRAFEVERFFKEGARTDLDDINSLLNSGQFLLLEDGDQLSACVYVRTNDTRGYIGLLSVDPERQGQGLGSMLMQHAEDFCARAGCRAIDLRIIHLRPELIAYYGRRGYTQRGTEPGDIVKGAKLPVHFIAMSKELGDCCSA